MREKKVYTEPLCEVTRFEVTDVVTASQWYGDENSLNLGSVSDYAQSE